MQNLRFISGNIFTTKYQTVVNTVNCVGVMGAGMALECRLRYPEMYKQYVDLCSAGKIVIGKLWLYKASDRWILNFPTKKDWKFPTKEQYLHAGLSAFTESYVAMGIKSIAFPLLGAQHGGLNASRSLEVIEMHLRDCTIPIEIYKHDPKAPDDLFQSFKKLVQTRSDDDLRTITGLRVDLVQRIRNAIDDPHIQQLNQLARIKGIGEKILEKAFSAARDGSTKDLHAQKTLDF